MVGGVQSKRRGVYETEKGEEERTGRGIRKDRNRRIEKSKGGRSEERMKVLEDKYNAKN